MKQISALMQRALKAVEYYLVADAHTLEVPKEYDGYAASFSASVISSDLFPTLAFYTDIHKMKGGAQEREAVRRYKLLQALYYIVVSQAENKEQIGVNALQQWAMSKAYESNPQDSRVRPWGLNRREEAKVQKQIMEAAIALKLALRNFPQKALSPTANQD